ncbi:acyl transferase/acyl hydrolase/lysophospholipase [Flagelloscypha sp. PMI_526]|nr:acyl transferase/acyl hydrolase/lysophospholipase [Flagelloscypha sp. PMI_526]
MTATALDPVTLLSLDAGGIRGLSEVDILNDMMYRLQYDEGEPEMPKPCERFDLIGGSGTGGLLAVLIGPLKLSVPVVYEIYLKIVRAAFSRVNGWPRPPPAADEEPRVNDPPHLVPLLKDIVRDALQDEDALMIDSSRGDQCKVFVCLHMLHTHPHPRLIRTYETNETDSTNYRIWEVLRATLSCPGILNVFDPKAQTFTDMATSQSLRGCNPSALVLQEAQAVFPQRTLSCLVNLGCGHVGSNETFSPAEEFVQIIGRECDRAAEDMVRATKDLVELETEWRRRKGLPSLRTDNPGLRRAPATFYHRFSVVLDFQKLGIAEWEVFADVIAVTRQYLLEHEPNSNLNRIVAESLIGKKPWILLGPPESTAM